MITDDATWAAFAKWVEARESDPRMLLNSPLLPPSYTRETRIERIEPYATQYDELFRQDPAYWECGEPDPEYFRPTRKLLALRRKLDKLHDKAFREVPNPAYDPERAAAYWEQRRNRFNQNTYVVTQSYTPQAHETPG